MLSVSVESVRRLAVTKQRLTGRLPSRPTKGALVRLVRELAYVQWDPISVVAPSHILSLWARLGDFRPKDIETLLWTDKTLLELWTPIASLVSTQDYPLVRSLMMRYPDSLTRSWGQQRLQAKAFLEKHAALRRRILRALSGGPLRGGELEAARPSKRPGTAWGSSSDVSTMLFHLHMAGKVMVVGRQGGQNLWGLTDGFLPSWVDRRGLSIASFEREAAQRALRALGTATSSEIHYYFPRGRYQDLAGMLHRLEDDGRILPLRAEGLQDREVRYVHRDDVPLLERVDGGDWEPRMSLLPPFDNLVSSPARTHRLFGFDYVREQFLPAAKRRFGFYVLPVLWGSRFVGRVDARFDKGSGRLLVNSVHAEPEAMDDTDVPVQLARTVRRLAKFVGAHGVDYSSRTPARWKRALR